MNKKIGFLVIGTLLLAVSFSLFTHAEQPLSSKKVPDRFFSGVTEIVYTAHGVLDTQRIQDQNRLQEKNIFLKNESFKQALGIAMKQHLDVQAVEKYKLRAIDGRGGPHNEIYLPNQIVFEMIYDFHSLEIDSESYVIGAVHTNLWRLAEVTIGDNQASVRYVPDLVSTQPPVAFIFKESDPRGLNEIEGAIAKSVADASSWININSALTK